MNRFIECAGVGKTYRGKTESVEALRGIDFVCNEGEFFCLLGRSGCGKSTLLQMIAGLETPTFGQIAVAGRELDGPSPEAAIVFQDHGLFPWMTVQKNVEFNMKARGTAAAERAARARTFIGAGACVHCAGIVAVRRRVASQRTRRYGAASIGDRGSRVHRIARGRPAVGLGLRPAGQGAHRGGRASR